MAIRKAKTRGTIPGTSRSGSSSSALKKAKQADKIAELRKVLIEAGFVALDEQAVALGLLRSTAWAILRRKHKPSGLSAATIKRMLRSTHLPEPARRVIQEYIEQKCAGESGTVSQEYVCFARSLVKCCEDKRVGWPGLDAAIGHPSPCGRCNHEQL